VIFHSEGEDFSAAQVGKLQRSGFFDEEITLS
jgi:hypothetical protein